MVSSRLNPGELLINDATPMDHVVFPDLHGRGFSLAGRTAEGYGSLAVPIPKSLLIDPSEFEARIKEKERLKTRVSDRIRAKKLPCKDQAKTNYCWMHGCVGILEVRRLIQNEPLVIFSPASAAAQYTKYRNIGGWGRNAIEWLSVNGVVPMAQWPANAIDKKYATAANIALAKKYRVDQWGALKPRNQVELFSLLLNDYPVAVGFDWWGHLVYACDAVWLDGEACPRIRNSWSAAWGDDGFGVLQGARAVFDDGVVCLSAIAS
jgi:hypothetical protein